MKKNIKKGKGFETDLKISGLGLILQEAFVTISTKVVIFSLFRFLNLNLIKGCGIFGSLENCSNTRVELDPIARLDTPRSGKTVQSTKWIVDSVMRLRQALWM